MNFLANVWNQFQAKITKPIYSTDEPANQQLYLLSGLPLWRDNFWPQLNLSQLLATFRAEMPLGAINSRSAPKNEDRGKVLQCQLQSRVTTWNSNSRNVKRTFTKKHFVMHVIKCYDSRNGGGWSPGWLCSWWRSSGWCTNETFRARRRVQPPLMGFYACYASCMLVILQPVWWWYLKRKKRETSLSSAFIRQRYAAFHTYTRYLCGLLLVFSCPAWQLYTTLV